MKKQIIKLTEEDLHTIIKASVNEVLDEYGWKDLKKDAKDVAKYSALGLGAAGTMAYASDKLHDRKNINIPSNFDDETVQIQYQDPAEKDIATYHLDPNDADSYKKVERFRESRNTIGESEKRDLKQKKVYKMTESDLHTIIKEAAIKAMTEQQLRKMKTRR